MIILGLANSKDSGACLMIDGKLISAVNEERLSRKKLTKEFPFQSIDWVLRSNGLKLQDVDALGTGVWKGIDSWEMFPRYVSQGLQACATDETAAYAINERLESSLRTDRTQNTILIDGLNAIGGSNKHLYRCSHHHAHAITAFYFSPFTRAMVMTLDGRGDFCSGSVSVMDKNGTEKLITLETEFNSIGYFYGWVTNFLGFVPDRHEGKVTGLAAAGNPKSCYAILKKMIAFRDGGIVANVGRFYKPNAKATLPDIEEELRRFSKEDVAAAAQAILEETVVSYAKHYLEITGERYLCVAGGIFANVLLNMKLRMIPGLEGLYVFPHMGDGGIAAGGAAYAHLAAGGVVTALETAYLGPQYSEEEIAKEIKLRGLNAIVPEDFANNVAKHLTVGKVVGFFSGKMEFGPRALGARSILVQATESDINLSLNKRLNRTEFMPFAPVTLEEEASTCYVGWNDKDKNPWFMTSCYECTDTMTQQSPAVVHFDKTARPQIVNRERNGLYYDVLKAYFQLTGIPTLINTSFNRHEEPIICSPGEALDEFLAGSIDVLSIYPFVLEHPQNLT